MADVKEMADRFIKIICITEILLSILEAIVMYLID
jgi:hypothetical protein